MLPHFNKYKSSFVNLDLKFIKLITDLDVVNQNIIESYEIWYKIKTNSSELIIYNTYLHKRNHKLHEYIIYDLKHFVDEIIATTALIKGKILNGKISITSIGDYLGRKNDKIYEFNKFIDFFKLLDNLANAYKHSYANSDFSVLGRDEDCFVALYSKYNDFSKESTPYVVSVNELIKEFNEFYKFAFETIDNLTKALSKK